MAKPLTIAPLTGVLDTRSSPDEIPQGGVRWRQNLQTVGEGKLRRGSGFTKLLDTSNYNNSDFHDQLLLFSASVRQPITMMYEAESTRKTRSLFVGTQGQIARLNAFSGNYKILGSGFGGTPKTSANAPRFQAAHVGDYLAFTNGLDKPKYHLLENSGADGDADILEFTDFVTIGLSQAGGVFAWNNQLFFFDVVMDGQRYGHRLIWSDFENPTGFDPAALDTITGFKDLFQGETILGGKPAGRSYLLYTTKGIWEISVIGGDQTYAFNRVYDGESNEGKAILKYPNTLTNLSDAHLWMAQDGVYIYSQYYAKPERLEWIHRASNLIFDNIDSQNCLVHVSGVYGDEVLLSVAQKGDTDNCPSITLRLNMTYKTVDIVDHGFTCFCNFTPQLVPTILDFIVENNICTFQNMLSMGYTLGNEGLPRPLPIGIAAFTPTYVYSYEIYTLPDPYGNVLTENVFYGHSNPYTLCNLLNGATLNDYCGGCRGDTLFIGASSTDWCVKELGAAFYREICLNPTTFGTFDTNGYTSSVGSYVLNGYDSIIRPASMYQKEMGLECKHLEVDYIAVPQDVPNQIGLRVGISGQIADVNTGSCVVMYQHSLKDLKCASFKSSADHQKDNTQPSETLPWNFFHKGKMLHFELKISGTGGDCILSRISADLMAYKYENY